MGGEELLMDEGEKFTKTYQWKRRWLAMASIVLGLASLVCAYMAAGWWLVGAFALYDVSKNYLRLLDRLSSSEGLAEHFIGRMDKIVKGPRPG